MCTDVHICTSSQKHAERERAPRIMVLLEMGTEMRHLVDPQGVRDKLSKPS